MDISNKINAARRGVFMAIDRWEDVKNLPRDTEARTGVETSFIICTSVMLQYEDEATKMGLDIFSPAFGPDPLERK